MNDPVQFVNKPPGLCPSLISGGWRIGDHEEQDGGQPGGIGGNWWEMAI